MRHIIKFYFIVSCLLLLSGCQQSDLMEEVTNASISSRAVQTVSYFKNVERYENDLSGEVYIKGEIHCTEEAEYTFIFSFQGSVGTGYDAQIGYNHIYPSNGSSFREITMKLKPGIHQCCVQIYFTGRNQQADARLVIRKINGTTSFVAEGSGDLVAQGISKMSTLDGSVPAHWTCPSCYCSLNGVGSTTCLSCGKDRP